MRPARIGGIVPAFGPWDAGSHETFRSSLPPPLVWCCSWPAHWGGSDGACCHRKRRSCASVRRTASNRRPMHSSRGSSAPLPIRNRGSGKSVPVSLLTPMAKQANALVRAEALLRLARVQAKAGHIDQALATYTRLRDESLIGPTEAPYSLLSRFARVQLLTASKRGAAARTEARELLADLQSGRFPVGKETFAWYESGARKVSAEPASATPNVGLALADVVEAIWSEWQIFQRSGSPTMSKRPHASTPVAVVAVLNANPDRLVALIHAGESIRNFGLNPAANGGEQSFRVTLLDERGTPIIGAEHRSSSQRATRILSAAGLPWRLSLESSNEGADEGLLASRRGDFAA